jgi:heavy metal sensor kinase
MRPIPIRVRLAGWYSLMMIVSLGAFGFVATLAVRSSIHSTVNEGLDQRIEGVRKIIADEGQNGTDALEDEFREYADGQGKGSVLRVLDNKGAVLFLSPGGEFLNGGGLRPTGQRTFLQQAADGRYRVLHETVSVAGMSYDVTVATALSDFGRAIDRFQLVLLLAAPGFLVVAAFGGYWLSQRALTPVDEITQAARDIGAQDLGRRLFVPKTGDELERLARTLNGMLDRLEKTFQRITKFTADASHELRTPVSVMRASAEIALRKPRSQTEYQETLLQILQESERLSQLIEQLLVLARSDSGSGVLPMIRTDIKEPLRHACQQASVFAEKKRLVITECISEKSLWVQGDRSSLERLFLILLDNAMKYTEDGGSIQVRLNAQNGFAIALIQDNGIGIAASDMPHIFERFYRADVARSRDIGGIGLGLAIGNWIAQVHNGEIRVESELTKGSCFEVRLPLIQ